MRILALDTSAAACSVALLSRGEVVERHEVAPRGHTRLILPMVDELLACGQCALAELDAIALGIGPGSFTGLRIAAGVAQGLAFGADLPVVPVSSLAATALGGLRDAAPPVCRAIVCSDARMGEIYLGSYERRGGELVASEPERLVKPGDVDVSAWEDGAGQCLALGSGWPCMAGASVPEAGRMAPLEELQRRFAGIDIDATPHAADIAELGRAGFGRGAALEPWQVEPAYLRDKVAWQRQS